MFHIVADFKGESYYITSHFNEKAAKAIKHIFQGTYPDATINISSGVVNKITRNKFKNSMTFTDDYISKNFMREVEYY